MIRKRVCKSVRQLEHQRKCRMQFNKRKRLFGLTVCWLVAFCFLLPSRPAGLSVTFLDVGQGDRIVLHSSDKAVLVDCGSSSTEDGRGEDAGPVSQESGCGAPGSCRHDPWRPGSHQRDPVSLRTPGIRGSRWAVL